MDATPSASFISTSDVLSAIRGGQPPLIVDVRRKPVFRAATDMIAGALARRDDREAPDFTDRTVAGALVGVWMSALFHWAEHPEEDMFATIDRAMELPRIWCARYWKDWISALTFIHTTMM